MSFDRTVSFRSGTLSRSRKILICVFAFTVLAIAWGIYEYGIISNRWVPLIRPSSVSGAAHYVWNDVGEFWYECSPGTVTKVVSCGFWDGSGRLKVSAQFELLDNQPPIQTVKVEPTRLQLQDGHVTGMCARGSMDPCEYLYRLRSNILTPRETP